jgi:GTP cyclohydrolase II
MPVAAHAKRETPHPRDNSLVKLEAYAEAPLPTVHGDFRAVVYRELLTGSEHMALVLGDVASLDEVLVRVHSECLTGEAFGSLKCDCRDQLDGALDRISQRGAGILIYLRQEGRGIGLGNKIRAYALQARGADTYEANRKLGFADDLRRYDLAAEILRHLGVHKIDLLTNNPQKVAALVAEGIEVARRLPSRGHVNPHNRGYLETKRRRSGHLIELDEQEE